MQFSAVLRQVLHQTNQLNQVKAAEICGSFAYLSPASLCTVVQVRQRAPQQLFFYYNKLQFKDLTSNQVVGSSNLSGRATFSRPMLETWVTDYTGDIGNTLGLNGFSMGSSLQVS